MLNKRSLNLLNQYIYKNESTPLSFGTLVVCGFCFLLILISTFSQFNINFLENSISYNPQIPTMIFIIYLLGRRFSFLVFLSYLSIGLFILPIFAFGGGISYLQNYFFGYFLGSFLALIITGTIIKKNPKLLSRLLGGLFGVLSIHFFGFVYCVILAIFKVIDYNLIILIVKAMGGIRIFLDILFTSLILAIAPYIKMFFWICMKKKPKRKKKFSVERIRQN